MEAILHCNPTKHGLRKGQEIIILKKVLIPYLIPAMKRDSHEILYSKGQEERTGGNLKSNRQKLAWKVVVCYVNFMRKDPYECCLELSRYELSFSSLTLHLKMGVYNKCSPFIICLFFLHIPRTFFVHTYKRERRVVITDGI